jgi:Holliday junction resolvasome RuvABC endonuclease subunit
VLERVLALDISTKTGFCLVEISGKEFSLVEHGQIKKTSEPSGDYPGNYVDWAYQCFGAILELIERLCPNCLVIEETAANSRSAYSQKILEFIHFLVAKFIRDTKIKCRYYQTGVWRTLVNSRASKEEKKHNLKVAAYKKKNNTKIAYGDDNKRIGKLTRKHVSIRRANENFGRFLKEPLRKKDEDAAESLLLSAAYIVEKTGVSL